jgi:hypothetical protein
MGVLDSRSGAPTTTPGTPAHDAQVSHTPGNRFVIGVTVVVVAFAAIIAFAMYWMAPLQ